MIPKEMLDDELYKKALDSLGCQPHKKGWHDICPTCKAVANALVEIFNREQNIRVSALEGEGQMSEHLEQDELTGIPMLRRGIDLSIGLGALSKSGFGEANIANIPSELCCPQCGTKASDNGECLVLFSNIPNPNPVPELVARAPMVLALTVDCRSCGYQGPGPTDSFLG